jgi:membrane protein YdbS with pleckstrin-like domain
LAVPPLDRLHFNIKRLGDLVVSVIATTAILTALVYLSTENRWATTASAVILLLVGLVAGLAIRPIHRWLKTFPRSPETPYGYKLRP